MRVREISHDRWHPFFDDFTHLHHGEHVNVETMERGGPGVIANMSDLPFVEILGADSRAGIGEWIEVIAGESPKAQATHCITKPSHVRLAEQEDGRAVALQIESAEGSVTMIRFEPSREGLPAGFRVN